MPPGSRRAHTKSRNGCGQCKRRKIKCDEQAPRCYNCTKWSVKCDFETRDGSISTTVIEVPRKRQSSKSSHESSSPPAQMSATLISSPSSVNLPHMELMHHYLTVTSLTLVKPGFAGNRWNEIVPSEALRYEFLMHALLAVSALHMAHLRGALAGSTEYLARARGHQDEALTRFRTSVIDITPENCTAAFLFSSTLLTFSMGLTQAVGLPSQDPVEDMVILLKSFRSHWKLFFSARQWIEAGPLGEFLPTHFRATNPSSDLTQDDDAKIALEELYNFNARTSTDDMGAQLYCDTILHVQNALSQGASLQRLLWPIIISEAFVELLSHRMPMALIIMAHGCALSKHGPDRWFMQGWMSKVVHNIAMTIGESWVGKMRWPLSELGVDISLEESNQQS